MCIRDSLCPHFRAHPFLLRGFMACQTLVRVFISHRIKPHAPPFVWAPINYFEFLRTYSPGRILNALAIALYESISTLPSIYCILLGPLGYLTPFVSLSFVSQWQCRPSRVLSPLVFFPISIHFPAPSEFPLPLLYSRFIVSTTCPGLSPRI